jgi:hypothetical protein
MLIAKSAHLFLPITKRTMLSGCLSPIVKPMFACFVLHRLNTIQLKQICVQKMSNNSSQHSDSSVDEDAANDSGLTIAINQEIFASFGLTYCVQCNCPDGAERWEFTFSNAAMTYISNQGPSAPVYCWRTARKREYDLSTGDGSYTVQVTDQIWLRDSNALLKTRENCADAMEPTPELFEMETPYTILQLKVC